MRILKTILLISLVLYLAGLLFIYTQQRKMMYFPPVNYLSPSEVGLSQASEVDFQTDDDYGVKGWWLPPQKGQPVVMFFHGNGSAVYSNYDIYGDLAAQGYGVMAAGYPGYPGSGGRPSELALVVAAQAQYDYLIKQGIAPENIVFYGTSLGAGVAAQLSKTRKPAFIIMEAPFTSALDIARSQMKIYPAALLMKDKYHSDEALQGSDIPMIWLHGTKDTIISYEMGRQLYEGYDGPKTAHVINDGQHTNLWFLGGREIVLEALSGL